MVLYSAGCAASDHIFLIKGHQLVNVMRIYSFISTGNYNSSSEGGS